MSSRDYCVVCGLPREGERAVHIGAGGEWRHEELLHCVRAITKQLARGWQASTNPPDWAKKRMEW